MQETKMSKFYLLLQVGSLIYNIYWEKKNVKYPLKDVFSIFFLVKRFFQRTAFFIMKLQKGTTLSKLLHNNGLS